MKAQNQYIFFRNDQEVVKFSFDPLDPICLDEADYKYFGRVLHELEPQIKDRGLIIYVTAWTVHELPSYGDNVIACILQDEWSREPKYRDKVAMVFKTCGRYPFTAQAYRHGGLYDSFSNLLGQMKALAQDQGAYFKTIWHFLSRRKLAPVYEIPLGCYAYEDVPFLELDQRENDLFFAGSMQHINGKKLAIKRPKILARQRMQDALDILASKWPEMKIKRNVTGSFKESIKTDNCLYLENMMNTKICPVPRGANLETFRFYEAIRSGCIPIGEAFPRAWYYEDAPIIRLKDWSEVETIVPELLKDKAMMQDLQQKVLAWWKEKCSEKATADFIAQKILTAFSR